MGDKTIFVNPTTRVLTAPRNAPNKSLKAAGTGAATEGKSDMSEIRGSNRAPFTILDQEGREALRVGDRILVEMTIQGVDFGDHTVLLTTKHATMSQPWRDLDVVYALLSSAPAIEPGQTVLILGRDTGIVLGQASDGTWAVEYQAGDGVKIGGYDASCLEVQS